jgi:hypothetical protein
MRASLLALAGFLAISPAAADPATWIAVSNTAMAITGDIVLDDYGIRFANGTNLELEPFDTEVVANWTGFSGPTPGNIYEVHSPSDPKLLNGNTLCGEKVTYIVTTLSHDGELTLNIYSSKQPPKSMDGVCASYSYEADLNETE